MMMLDSARPAAFVIRGFKERLALRLPVNALVVFAALFAGTVQLLALSRSMAALQMGEATAIGLGVSARWLRVALISVAVGFAAIATVAVGPLGFVGLIAPHAARRISRSGVGLHLMISAVVGAFVVTLADLLGRVLFAPIQIPAGLVTAIVGVPVFIILLQRAQAKSSL